MRTEANDFLAANQGRLNQTTEANLRSFLSQSKTRLDTAGQVGQQQQAARQLNASLNTHVETLRGAIQDYDRAPNASTRRALNDAAHEANAFAGRIRNDQVDQLSTAGLENLSSYRAQAMRRLEASSPNRPAPAPAQTSGASAAGATGAAAGTGAAYPPLGGWAAFGNQAQMTQRRNEAGSYELILRVNEPERFRTDQLVAFTSNRPFTRDDFSTKLGPLIGPIPNPLDQRPSPALRGLNDKLAQLTAPANRVEPQARPAPPMSDNPLQRAWSGAVAGGHALLEGAAGTAITLGTSPASSGSTVAMPITPMALEGQRLNNQIMGDLNRDLTQRVDTGLRAMAERVGARPGPPEYEFALNSARVAEGLIGVYELGSGAISLARAGSNMRLATQNARVLQAMRDPTPGQLPRAVDFVVGNADAGTPPLSARDYGAMPTEMKLALREGLASNRSAPGVQQALSRLDELDGVSRPGLGRTPAPAVPQPVARATALNDRLGGAIDAYRANPTPATRKAVNDASAEVATLLRQNGGRPPAGLDAATARELTGRQALATQMLDATRPQVQAAQAQSTQAPNAQAQTPARTGAPATGNSARPAAVQTPVRDLPVQSPSREVPGGVQAAPDPAPIVPGATPNRIDGSIVPSATPGAAPLSTLRMADAATNTETLSRIRDASPREINEWVSSLSIEEKRALPAPVKDAILKNVDRRIAEAAAAPRPPATPESAIMRSPEMSRITREMVKDLELGVAGDRVAGQVQEYGPFRVVLFDSGNGGLAAAGVASKMLDRLTGGKTQLVTMGDHQNQPYGIESEGEITQLVFNAVETGAKTNPDVIAMACNTACIALFRAQETGVAVPSSGIPVVNLIDNTSRAVAQNPAIYGERPMILSTGATERSGLYQRLIPEYSNGQVTPYNVGGSDPAVTRNGKTEIRDLATLVNQLAHKDPSRAEEVLNAARHYVNKMPTDMTSMVMCCTHYPELIPHFRQALDERGMQHVPIFDPMKDQMLTVAQRLGAGVEGTLPPSTPQTPGPDIVITSATGRPNPGQSPEAAARTHLDVFPSVPALAGKDMMTVSGQNFGRDYDPGVVNAYLNGEISATDAATVGFHGRNLHTFFNPGGARDAANVLTEAKSVMMMTGFNVPPNPNVPGSVPKPETDGPPGTAALAAALLGTGKEVTLVTDPLNKPVLEASLRALGANLDDPNLRIIEFNAKGPAADAEARRLLDTYRPDVVGAIELPGRNAGGTRTNMGGVQIDGYNPDLDAILIAANERTGTRTFGVGDGGNEAGMGDLDLSRVALPSPSTVGAQVAVTAENSNLGAYAIAAEYLNAIGRNDLLLTPEAMQASVEAGVQAGAVDGVSRMPTATVDGFPFEYHERNLNHLNGAVQGTWPPDLRPSQGGR